MNACDHLLTLQWAQLKHDEVYHRDIVILPLAQRMKHMALHNAKYTAYFLAAVDDGDEARFKRTLTDAFIICLAVANTLNQHLGRELTASNPDRSLLELGKGLAGTLGRDDDPLWITRQYCKRNGLLAKLCESWDHLEDLQFRSGMHQCNYSLVSAVLAEAAARDIDLSAAYRERIRAVEARSIFDSFTREGAGGEA
jgi:hypothetical protein